MAPEKVAQRQRSTGDGLDGTVDLARDRDLVERCQGGDRSAFEELYHRYHRRLFHFCLRRLHEPYEAEDAVQEAFTKAWRALPNFAGERRFYPWLTVIAGNVCTDVLRRRSRLTPVDDVPLPLVDPDARDVDELVLREVDIAMVAEALTKLSDRHQRVLQLREGSGWSTQQLAEYEGVAVPAMETLLWRARQALKREFTALAETGGRLGVALGLGLAAFRRFVLRATTRAAEHVPALQATSFRGPGALVASLVIAGGVVAGVATTHGASPAGGTVAMPATVPTGSQTTARSTLLPSPLPAGSLAPEAAAVTTAAPPGNEPAISPGTAGTNAVGGASTSVGGAGGGTAALGGSTLPAGAGPAATGTLGSALSGVGSTVSSAASRAGSTVSSVVSGAGSTVSSVVSGAGSTVSSVAGSLGSTVSSAATTLTGTVNGVTNGLGGALNGLTGGPTTTTTTGGLPGGL